MRLLLICAIQLTMTLPALAENELPDGIEQLLTCAHTYALRSEELRSAGDEDGALEFYHMGDALLWQARSTLESAGYNAQQIEGIDANHAMMVGFNYGAGMGEEMLATCLAAWDGP